MAFKFSVAFETVDPGRRDAFLEGLCDLIDEHRRGADTAKVKGVPIPDLSHFGDVPLTPMERIEGFADRYGARVEFNS